MGNYLWREKAKDPEVLAWQYEYIAAGEIYEKMALLELSNDSFFRACICYLANSVKDGRDALTRFKENVPSFATTLEYEFLDDAMIAVETRNTSAFTRICAKYDKRTECGLDTFSISMLLRIKNTIQ